MAFHCSFDLHSLRTRDAELIFPWAYWPAACESPLTFATRSWRDPELEGSRAVPVVALSPRRLWSGPFRAAQGTRDLGLSYWSTVFSFRTSAPPFDFGLDWDQQRAGSGLSAVGSPAPRTAPGPRYTPVAIKQTSKQTPLLGAGSRGPC